MGQTWTSQGPPALLLLVTRYEWKNVGFCCTSSQSASCVFLCLKSGDHSFAYNQKSGSNWSTMYSPHPMNKCYHKNRESITDFLYQQRIMSQDIDYYYLTSAKEFLPKFRTWQNSNQERAIQLTPTRAMAPLTNELWHDWCSVTFSDLRSQLLRTQKNSYHSFSIWPPRTAEKLPIKLSTFIPYKLHWGIAFCIDSIHLLTCLEIYHYYQVKFFQ